MKNLLNTIYINQFNHKVLLEEYNQDVNDIIINESFKSNLLKNLANAIYKAEEQHRNNDIKNKEENNKRGYDYYTKTEKSFASIFGPITKTNRYNKISGIQGLKWSEITDDDFKLVTGDDIAKKLKQLYTKKIKFDCIACTPGTQNPIFFIKGYGETNDVNVYRFNSSVKWNSGVNKVTTKAYKYQERGLKYDEASDLLDGLDVYVLEITDDMIKSYHDLHDDRVNSRKGMINYDKESLEALLKKQKSRYKTLVDEMKATRLQNNKEDLFEDIKKVNDEVVQLYKDVMSNPEYLDKYFDLGNIMNYVSYAYESFYKSMKYTHKSNKSVERAQKNGHSPEEAARWGEYDREYAKGEINNAKEYIDKIRKQIKEIRDELK